MQICNDLHLRGVNYNIKDKTKDIPIRAIIIFESRRKTFINKLIVLQIR